MPRARSLKNGQPSEAYNPASCPICNVVISNKTDLPRHMKIHSHNREKLMHRCPYPECNFENLQKSNVETHIRTHTKSKTNCCPDCDFTTVDPGSLTRHRKRIHGYIPKLRRTRQSKPQSEADSSKSAEIRFAPYSPPGTQQQGDMIYFDPPQYDSGSGSSVTPPAGDLVQQKLSDFRSRSRSRSQSPGGHPPNHYAAVAHSHSFASSSPQRMILPPAPSRRPSPPIDPVLLSPAAES